MHIKQHIHWLLRAFSPQGLGTRRPSSLLEKQKAVGAAPLGAGHAPQRRSPEQPGRTPLALGTHRTGGGHAGWCARPPPPPARGSGCAHVSCDSPVSGRRIHDTPNFETCQDPPLRRCMSPSCFHTGLFCPHGPVLGDGGRGRQAPGLWGSPRFSWDPGAAR